MQPLLIHAGVAMAAAMHEVADLLANAKHVVVMTGAGVSAESGIPTFRDALEGLWSTYSPQQLATPEAFARDPELVSRWYDERRMAVLKCKPNPGHYALAKMESSMSAAGREFTLLTQNVDGLHVRAGSERVVELHGSLTTWRCTETGRTYRDLPEPFDEYPPVSEDGGLLRPGVVWFGEALPATAMRAATMALRECDLYVAVGTSGVVYPAAGFVHEAARSGAKTVEVNLEDTPLTQDFGVTLRGKSGDLLPELAQESCGVSL